MKKYYLLFITVFLAQLTFSQIITIPDSSFKYYLLVNYDTNNDDEIQVSEIEEVLSLNVSSRSINSLEGIQYFANLESLSCSFNNIGTLDVSHNTNLTILYCGDNSLSSLDVTQNPNLVQLGCSFNNLGSLDLTQNPNLKILSCGFNSLGGILDVTQNPNLENLSFRGCGLLESLNLSQNPNLNILNGEFCSSLENLNLKNGSSLTDIRISYSPNLNHICVDEEELIQIQTIVDNEGYTGCVVNSYCSFEPGGETYIISGQNSIDIDVDGCDTSDPIFPNLKLNISDGTDFGSYISNDSGSYAIVLNEGSYTITPEVESSSYFTISPSAITVDFPTDTSPYTQDICVIPSGTYNDLEIAIIPVELARPGFDTDYKIVYKNKGTTVLSGSIVLNFNDDFMNFVTASPTEDISSVGVLTWNFSDLAPFESHIIYFTMNLNTSTDTTFPLNDGDVLDFTATVNPTTSDETPTDNVFDLNQGVVNSYDPNDKTCLEGIWISPSMVGEYVHYLIRFENTGTASAVNVVVKDDINPAYYDINTLVPLDSSHSFVTNIDNDKVEFIFENIFLPFDDASNDGYVLFKIKTLSTLVLNDTFKNKAEIYFDFNSPIITNEAETIVTNNPLSTTDYILNQNINVYPKPTKNILYINGKYRINTVDIFDLNGRQLQKVSFINSKKNIEIDIERLPKGFYILKITSAQGVFTDKILKD